MSVASPAKDFTEQVPRIEGSCGKRRPHVRVEVAQSFIARVFIVNSFLGERLGAAEHKLGGIGQRARH